METIRRLIPARWLTSHCTGCSDPSPHDAHLSIVGKLWLATFRGGTP